MRYATGDGIMAMLVAIALIVVCLRFFTRIHIEHRRPITSDYFALGGWICSLGWLICMVIQYALWQEHGPRADGLASYVPWLKVVFASLFFFDFGLMLTKISILMFYWWLIPRTSKPLRITLWICSIYTACAFIGTLFSDIFFCWPVNRNWALDQQEHNLWNSRPNTFVNWSLNVSTDIILFLLPAALIYSVKLRKAQKLMLVAVFSLGLITIIVSICRFAAPVTSIDFEFAPAAAIWFQAEMCTATIVVCMPSFKNFMVKVVELCRGTFTDTRTKPTDPKEDSSYRYGVWTGEGDIFEVSARQPTPIALPKAHDGRDPAGLGDVPKSAVTDDKQSRDGETPV